MFFIKIISKCLENLFAFLFVIFWIFVFFIAIMIGIHGCTIEHPIDKYKANKLANEWGGLYVFDKDIRDEILEQERKKEEWQDEKIRIIKEKNLQGEELENFYDLLDIDKRYPNILSNGCRYFWELVNYNESFEPYYAKIREYVGDERYEKMKSGLSVSSYYVCEDEKQLIPVTIIFNTYYSATTFGLFFYDSETPSLTKSKIYLAGKKETIKYLVNGKFIEDKSIKGIGWR